MSQAIYSRMLRSSTVLNSNHVCCGTARIGQQIKLQQCCPVSRRPMSSSSNASGLSMACQGDIAIITMDRQDNRLNKEALDTFHDMLDQIDRNHSIKGIITTGQGKFYGNGLDTDWMGTLSCEDLMAFMKYFQSTVKRVLVSPVPSMAALNGHTFAGGAVMAFAHDFRVMNADKGWICFNEVLLGITFFEFLGSMLSTKIGSGINVNDALIYCQRFTAEEALNKRLIHSKAPSSDLLEHSVKLLTSYIGKNGMNRSTVKSAKEHIYRDCLANFERHKDEIGFAKQFMTDTQLAELKSLNL